MGLEVSSEFGFNGRGATHNACMTSLRGGRRTSAGAVAQTFPELTPTGAGLEDRQAESRGTRNLLSLCDWHCRLLCRARCWGRAHVRERIDKRIFHSPYRMVLCPSIIFA